MKKQNEKGIALIWLITIIVAVLGVAFTTIYLIFNSGSNSDVPIEDLSVEERKKLTTEEKIEANEWSMQIVSDVTDENIPIPVGYNYVQGNLETGLIIKDKVTNVKYLFIPYEKDVNENVDDYYKNVDYISMESDVLNSIQKYNGFYVVLNSNISIDDLKTMKNDEYNIQSEQMYLAFQQQENVNSHILYKEELAQINNYLNKNNINLGENTIGAQALVVESYASIYNQVSDVQEDGGAQNLGTNNSDGLKVSKATSINLPNDAITKVASSSSNTDRVYMYQSKSDIYDNKNIPIPTGYKYSVNDGILSIQDEDNKNLIYIWVPMSEELLEYSKDTAAKKQLWTKVYGEYEKMVGEKISTDSYLYDILRKSEETLPPEFKESIEDYGGFYISEAELGYDKNNDLYNKARGMVEYSATKTINGGDYYRGSNSKSSTYRKMKALAEETAGDHSSVKGHLMYGVEWDSAILWIAQTNKNYKDSEGNGILTVLAGNSTYVGKYSNSNLGANSSAKDVEYFNKIWGLGGNLAEITQETYDGNLVTRGGSYNKTGEAAPIASRESIENTNEAIKRDDIGFRTALYITPGLKSTTINSDTYTPEDEEDTITEIDGKDYYLFGNVTRWVNKWEGTKVYKEPDVTSEVTGTLSFASEVIVNAKSKDVITTSDGTEIVWARIKTKNNTYLFVNAKDLTDATVTVGNNVSFIRSTPVTRYHKSGLIIYSLPTDSINDIAGKMTYVGAVKVVGKSTDKSWAMINVNGVNRFVLAKNLTESADIEEINGIRFVKGDEQERYVNEDNISFYEEPYNSVPKSGEEKIIELLKNNTKVTIYAKSEDGKWSKISYNGKTGYCESKFLKTSDESQYNDTIKDDKVAPDIYMSYYDEEAEELRI